MITCIREVRRDKGLTLQDVADRCDPPTTAQTIGRLETGTRTVSLSWLHRIAAALGVAAADLVRLPTRMDLPIAALLGENGAVAPRRAASIALPHAGPGQIAVLVTSGLGDYRAGDQIWCERLAPEAFADALNRDILVPRNAGRLAFGRLIGREGARLHLLPLGPVQRQLVVAGAPWIAVAVRLVRAL